MKKPLHCTTNDRSVFSCSNSQCYVTALKFKTMLPYTSRKGQHTFGSGQPCPLANIPFFHLCAYLISKSSNSLMGISEYHSGCSHVKILGKLFSIPHNRKNMYKEKELPKTQFLLHRCNNYFLYIKKSCSTLFPGCYCLSL